MVFFKADLDYTTIFHEYVILTIRAKYTACSSESYILL